MQYIDVYDCIYSAKGIVESNGKTHPVSVSLGHHACFGDIYSKIRNADRSTIDYSIYLYAEDVKNRGFNPCTKLETKKILRCLQKVVDFSYKFTKGQFTSGYYSRDYTDFNILNIKVSGNYAQHLWLTTMLRCFFEYPYNIAAKEACVLQANYSKIDGLDISKANWINLYLTIASKIGSRSNHGIVDAGRQPLPYTYQEWKQKLSKTTAKRDIIESLRSKHSYKEDWELRITEEAYKEGIENRAAKYVAAYKDKLSWKK